jgi:hypothetical protein
MPKAKFDQVKVKNLTDKSQTLRSADRDSIDIPAKSEVKVAKKFITWQPPSPRLIRVLSHHPKKESRAIKVKDKAQAEAAKTAPAENA